MRLTGITTRELRMPFPSLAADSRYKSCDLAFCELTTDEGLSGLGFAYALSGGAHAITSLISRVLWPLVSGQDPTATHAHWTRMRAATHHMGGGLAALAIAAVDIALWDLTAKSRDEPLYRTLGATRNQVPAYGSGRASISLELPDLLKAVRGYVDEGFSAVKVRIGRPSVEEDLRRLQAVRHEFGPELRLMTDANETLSLSDALWLAPRLVDLGIAWLEEPLPAEDLAGHVELCQRTALPISAGEHLFSRRQFGEYLARQAATIFQPDAVIVGGITEFLQVAHACEVLDRPIVPHFLTELHVHLAAAIPSCRYVEFYPFLETVLTERLAAQAGVVTASDRPGHGLVVRPEALERYALA